MPKPSIFLFMAALLTVMAGCSSGGSKDSDTQNSSNSPNLLLSSALTYTPLVPNVTDTLSFAATVNNSGDIGAPASRWDVTRDGVSGFRTGTVGPLAAGASTPLFFTVQEAGAANHTYVLRLDADEMIAEANEGDNQSVATASDAFNQSTDLQVSGTTNFAPTSPTTNNSLTISAVFVNAGGIGSVVAMNVPWTVSRNGTPGFASGTISSLAPGTSVIVPISVGFETSGTNTYTIAIDPASTISDPNPFNNSFQLIISVAPAASG